jgi:hypothetical protein
MNTRRYPRSTQEAFQWDAESAQAFHGPYTGHGSKHGSSFVIVLLVIIAVLFILGSSMSPMTDNSGDYAKSDKITASNKAIQKCLGQRGQGAGVVLDEDDLFKACKKRR